VALENIPYTADDYRRMVRMGANFQVVRMPMGPIGAWPGKPADDEALAHFDELVRLGKAAGLRTVFRLVVYGQPFREKQWDMLWKNTDGTQDKVIEGWTRIWTRYKDEPSVFGCDLLNAPHLYRLELPLIVAILDDLQRQAAISKVPLLLGEWGAPTRANTDGNPAQEARYTRVYQETVNQLDTRGIGGIKAWFCGMRNPIPVKGSTNWMTWAIFSDKSPAGRVERKYILDVVVRPRPLGVAGRLEHYGTDFATLTFTMTLQTDPALGATEMFVPAERHYPGGFRVEVGPGLTLAHDPGARTLRTVSAADAADREQAKQIRWDDAAQHLIVDQWVGAASKLTLKVRPEKLK
jgi:hypothetical protein